MMDMSITPAKNIDEVKLILAEKSCRIQVITVRQGAATKRLFTLPTQRSPKQLRRIPPIRPPPLSPR
jgi:hypothetical protein